jgi:predicted carbohydrate-binding protein with CBM5 and CBM33 domain
MKAPHVIYGKRWQVEDHCDGNWYIVDTTLKVFIARSTRPEPLNALAEMLNNQDLYLWTTRMATRS